MMGKAKIEGYCHEDYEPVKKQFEHMIKKGIEENAQLCVYVGGDCVIDLYGSAKGDEEFNEDKITVSQQIKLKFNCFIEFMNCNFSDCLEFRKESGRHRDGNFV